MYKLGTFQEECTAPDTFFPSYAFIILTKNFLATDRCPGQHTDFTFVHLLQAFVYSLVRCSRTWKVSQQHVLASNG